MSCQPLNILITSKADQDEQTIYKYISKKFGKVYAEKFRVKVVELFKMLAITPLSGRIAKNDGSLRVFVMSRQNKLVYKITENDIVILRILSTRTKSAVKY